MKCSSDRKRAALFSEKQEQAIMQRCGLQCRALFEAEFVIAQLHFLDAIGSAEIPAIVGFRIEDGDEMLQGSSYDA
ncbi:hypothetical protein ACXR0O_24585 [Verrucomicrobiota bacterium sgz303538]